MLSVRSRGDAEGLALGETGGADVGPSRCHPRVTLHTLAVGLIPRPLSLCPLPPGGAQPRDAGGQRAQAAAARGGCRQRAAPVHPPVPTAGAAAGGCCCSGGGRAAAGHAAHPLQRPRAAGRCEPFETRLKSLDPALGALSLHPAAERDN
jgi:hypothetical protein